MIWEVREARPDGFKTVFEEITCLDTENGSPHGGDEGWMSVSRVNPNL
jgi:hypothetical protein